jgi:hypothetical protein
MLKDAAGRSADNAGTYRKIRPTVVVLEVDYSIEQLEGDGLFLHAEGMRSSLIAVPKVIRRDDVLRAPKQASTPAAASSTRVGDQQ